MQTLNFKVLGLGAWGSGFTNWPELASLLSSGDAVSDTNSPKGPKPEIIPANERRRAPLAVRLAVESSWQATEDAKLEPAELPCVFVSGLGDTQLTDYMCTVLAGDNKALSPTKFHNSVHNAAAGYWTISTGCTQAANSIAGFQESVSLALMEALIQCFSEQRPILITFYDAPSSEVLRDLLSNESSFAASIIVAPIDTTIPATSQQHACFSAQVEQRACDWPPLQADSSMQPSYQNNPAAKILSLLALVAAKADSAQLAEPLRMPLSASSSLAISRLGADCSIL